LKLCPTAWAKLLFWFGKARGEVSGFALSDPKDPLKVLDFALIKQMGGAANTELDDDALAEYQDSLCGDGTHEPWQCMRIWWHTHPGMAPSPSSTDKTTFARLGGDCNWFVMLILGQDQKAWARLSVRTGKAETDVGVEIDLPVEVDWGMEFSATDYKGWQQQLNELVSPTDYPMMEYSNGRKWKDRQGTKGYDGYGKATEHWDWYDKLYGLDTTSTGPEVSWDDLNSLEAQIAAYGAALERGDDVGDWDTWWSEVCDMWATLGEKEQIEGLYPVEIDYLELIDDFVERRGAKKRQSATSRKGGRAKAETTNRKERT